MYGQVSNLKINMTKSKIMAILAPQEEIAMLHSSFPVVQYSNQIRGNFTAGCPKDLYTLNYVLMLDTIKGELHSWKTLSLLVQKGSHPQNQRVA